MVAGRMLDEKTKTFLAHALTRKEGVSHETAKRMVDDFQRHGSTTEEGRIVERVGHECLRELLGRAAQGVGEAMLTAVTLIEQAVQAVDEHARRMVGVCECLCGVSHSPELRPVRVCMADIHGQGQARWFVLEGERVRVPMCDACAKAYDARNTTMAG